MRDRGSCRLEMTLPNRLRLLWILAILALRPDFAIASSAAGGHDAAFREGWSLLQKERYAEARAVFAKIPPLGYDLGDYVVYFGGEAAAREGIAYLATAEEVCGECLHSSGEIDRQACRRCGGTSKVSKTVLGNASPEQVEWFLGKYPAREKKGDPAQGWAEGYK